MIGEPTKQKIAIKNQTSENAVSSQTSLGRNFHATETYFDRPEPKIYYVSGVDNSWDNNTLQIAFFSDSNAAENVQIGNDLDIMFWIDMHDGTIRGDVADRGSIRFYYDVLLQKITGRFKFEVDNRDGTLAYTFTEGVFNITKPFGEHKGLLRKALKNKHAS
ncbi:hypothetical protein BFW86_12635 [Pseudomonas fluorescens]|nr:hypothetical protein BFW86_12635 [Pseudomonas fluorescens]